MRPIYGMFLSLILSSACASSQKNKITRGELSSPRSLASKNHSCKAKALPPTSPVLKAIDRFREDKTDSNAKMFDHLTEAVEGFSKSFLSSYPKDCDRSKITKALNDLKKETSADNLMDAGYDYLHRLAQVFLALSLHVEESLKADLLNLKKDLEEKAQHEFRSGYI